MFRSVLRPLGGPVVVSWMCLELSLGTTSFDASEDLWRVMMARMGHHVCFSGQSSVLRH